MKREETGEENRKGLERNNVHLYVVWFFVTFSAAFILVSVCQGSLLYKFSKKVEEGCGNELSPIEVIQFLLTSRYGSETLL